MKKIKILSLAIVVLFLFSMVACAKDSGNVQPENINSGQADGDPQEMLPETETKSKMLPEVPENLNLEGYNFRLIYNAKYDETEWGVDGIEAEEEMGEAINDAAYRRNAYVTENYNFEITGFPYSMDEMSASFVKKIVMSGEDAYDAVIIRQNQAPSLITSGSFVDLKTMPYLDFEKPWWDKGIMELLSIGGKQFGAFGDLIVTANNALRIIMFNKKIAQEHMLENLYALVKENKWTLDKFYEMSKDVPLDLNGDGVFGAEDRYGLVIQNGGVIGLAFGAGESLTSKNAEDFPVLTIGSERSLQVFEKIYDIVHAQNLVLYDSAFADTWRGLQRTFEDNRGLFFGEVLQLVERMRASDTDFGILPFPKYDESQENYYCFGDSWCMNHIFVPITNRHFEQTGQILEILNAESYYTVRPAYYDKSLNGKFVRDEESSEMLDIILSNKIISLDEMFGWGMYGTISGALTSNSAQFASVIDKNTDKVTKAIEKTVDIILNIE